MRPAAEVEERDVARSVSAAHGGADAWLSQRRRAVVALLAALAAVVRVVVFVQLSGQPPLVLHRWDATDMHFVDGWARAIAAGDWLQSRPLHPYHPWAEEIVRGYIAVHPEVAETLANEHHGSDPDERARYLWSRWNGGAAYHVEPLYAYLVALTYRCVGADVRWVFVWQMIAGVAATVLLYLAVCAQLGDTVAAVATLLVSLAGPLVYQEMVLLRESLVAATGVGLVFLTGRARDAARPLRWLGLGVATGVAALLQAVFAAYGAVVLVVLLATRRRTALVPAAALLAGALVGVAPLVARNVAVGVPALGPSGSGALMFLESNAVDYRPGLGFVVSDRTRAIMGETDGRFWPTVSWTLRTHQDTASILRMVGAKAATVADWYEVPINTNFYFFRLFSSVLRVLPVTFFVLLPLGIVGLVVGLPTLARTWPLYLLVGCHLAHLLAFNPVSAERIPLVPALAPFAALTLVDVARGLAGRRLVTAAVLAATTIAVGTWTGRPRPPGAPPVGAVDFWAAYQTSWKPAIEAAERDGDPARAADVFRASLAYEPAAVREVDARHPAPRGPVADLVNLFASVHDAYANELQQAGRTEEAQREAERAHELATALPPPEPADAAPAAPAPPPVDPDAE